MSVSARFSDSPSSSYIKMICIILHSEITKVYLVIKFDVYLNFKAII